MAAIGTVLLIALLMMAVAFICWVAFVVYSPFGVRAVRVGDTNSQFGEVAGSSPVRGP